MAVIIVNNINNNQSTIYHPFCGLVSLAGPQITDLRLQAFPYIQVTILLLLLCTTKPVVPRPLND